MARGKTLDVIAKDLETLYIIVQRHIAGFSAFVLTLLGAASATAFLALLGIVASSYTPGLTGIANLSAAVAFTTYYIRVGTLVVVFGKFTADPVAAAATLTQLGIAVPIASDFDDNGDVAGVSRELVGGGTGQTGGISADTTDNYAVVTWLAASTSNLTHWFIFGYVIK